MKCFKRIKFKHMKLILAVSVTLVFIQIVITTNPKLSVGLNKVIYIVVDFLDYYVRTQDLTLPRGSRIGSSSSNPSCLMPHLDYNSTLAQNFLQSDEMLMRRMLDSCLDEPEEKSLRSMVRIESLIHDDGSGESHRLDVAIDRVEGRFGVSRDLVKCFVQAFDKHLNESEQVEEAAMTGDRVELNSQFTVLLNASGYFYLCCINLGMRNSKLFDLVLTVFPYNMSDLITHHRLKYGQLRDRFMRRLPQTPVYFDLPFNRSSHYLPLPAAEQTNILIIGIDSVSANHFKRVFPRTHAYLSRETLLYEHFNSVGANTYPNIVAMLSGVVEEDLNEEEFRSEIDAYRRWDGTFHDHFPFVWHEFERLGYVTHFQEDGPHIAIFNYYKDGFRYWPTCVYGRPYWLKYYETRSGPDKCHLGEPLYATWFHQIESFVERMNSHGRHNVQKAPYFSFNFITEYTHAYLAVPWQFDQALVDFFGRLDRNGYLDNTMLVFMTDHGNRLKFFAYATEMGKLERYLPYLSIKLPKAWKSTKYMQNAQANRDKLVSFFDLYQTLRHLLYINTFKDANESEEERFEQNLVNVRSERGISLLRRVPLNRTCMDALIGDKFCSCFRQANLTEADLAAETGIDELTFDSCARQVVDAVNALTEHTRSLCRSFRLDRVVEFKRLSLNRITVYSVVVVMQPGEAWFEAWLKLDPKGRRLHQLVLEDDPVRLSAYGNQSYCVKDLKLVNFCYCNDL